MGGEGSKVTQQVFVLVASVVFGSIAGYLLQRYAVGAIGGGAIAGAVLGLIAGRKLVGLVLGALGGAGGGVLVHLDVLTPVLRAVSRSLHLGNM